ncbi:MAG TPA: glycosyltransferase family protein [Vicinamibacterales bacterium]|nr:glycosyltransferase family protein [Vicinamibacterales bacterium]
MKTVPIIQARMTSSRLPGKILKPILGRPMLELLIERLRRAKHVDDVVVATTSRPTDDPVEELCARIGAGCFRGSEDDVLDRVLGAAHAHAVDLIVEITGDCPLIDPTVVDRLVEMYHEGGADYVANVLTRTYPRGLDTQVFPTSVLEDVARLTNDPVDHEHVSLYIYEHPERFRLRNLESGLPERYWSLRLTVDTPQDFALITAIYEALYPAHPDFALADVIALLDRRPDLVALNADIQQKPVR